MTIGALKHRDISEVDGVLKRLFGGVTAIAFTRCQTAEVYRVFEGAGAWILFGWARGIEKHLVADIAIVGDHLAGIALVLTIVATETTRRLHVTDVVWVGLPVGLHLRKEIVLINALNLRNGSVN